MEATIFTGWIYDHLLPHSEKVKVAHPLMLRASTLITSNRPVQDWGKLLGDSAAVSAMLDRLLHHGHVLQCGPRSWRTKTNTHGENQ